MSKHTPGPWKRRENTVSGPFGVTVVHCMDNGVWGEKGCHSITKTEATANARLIAAAPELLEALQDAADLAWIEDSHVIQFDSSVMFGPHYDFSGLDGPRRIEFYGMYSCIVWPGEKWSAYCTYEGTTWFEKFDTSEQAKEACMQLLDKVLPHHPAMRARAAIAKATGGDV
ncbi:hypothetical protein [Pseudomonas sp. zfem003]|uniref:hypothetical protein n=1 Tax=Pseudomonas sp. zfem003 TaxID=3078198 RepID=UPI00292A2AB6|nr:hypothetical protein [Pseudomonas sp. zfem003]MDU9398074.1 hypothetical protein [Pseudomonas sp. zfem003]